MSISIRLPADLEDRLQNLAAVTGRSINFYVAKAILEQLDDLETLYLAEHELTAIYAGVPSASRLAGAMHRHALLED